jgi:hypothetical protein
MKELANKLNQSSEILFQAMSEVDKIDKENRIIETQEIGELFMKVRDLELRIYKSHPELKPNELKKMDEASSKYQKQIKEALSFAKQGQSEKAIRELEGLYEVPESKYLEGTLTGLIANIKRNASKNKK